MDLRERLDDLPEPDESPSPPSTPEPPTSSAHPGRCSGSTTWPRGSPAGNDGRCRRSSIPSASCSPPTTAWRQQPRSAPSSRRSRRRCSPPSPRDARRSAASPVTPAPPSRRSTSGSASRRGTSATRRRCQTDRFAEIVDIAWAAVDAVDGDLLVLGEMGIGNTTASAAVAAALAGGETAAWVGRGTGIDDATLTVKRAAVQQAVRRIAGVTDPLEVLREVGGSELVAIAAAVVAARHRSLPVVLDGYVVTASVLPLVLLAPTGARPLHGRPLLRRARPPPVARPPRQASAARPRHAPRRGQRGDGRRAADRHGLRRHHRGPDDAPSGSADT